MAANAFHMSSILNESPQQSHLYCGAYANDKCYGLKEFIPQCEFVK